MFGRLGRRLKDNIKIKFGGIISEYLSGRTKKLKEGYVRGIASGAMGTGSFPGVK
jgi:hypothetical protein